MIYFLIPVYNEVDNLETLHKNLVKVLPNEEKCFIFSDDGSTDKSLEQIKILFKNLSFHIISDGKNYGPGHAFLKGFEWFLDNSKNDSDIIVTLEADNTSDLNILPNMISINRLGIDMVLASIYVQGGTFFKTSLFRKIASSVANLILRFAFDVKILTLSSFYRVYSKSLIQKIKTNNKAIIEEYGFICMVELLMKAIKQDAKVIEYPMTLHSDKRIGKSKMKIIKTTWSYLRFLLKAK